MSNAEDVFPDQSHIDRVRDALWVPRGGGASVMVGSGFSKNAVKSRPDAGEPPILRELAREIANRLYPQSDGAVQEGEDTATSQLLSRAQEYETAFGRSDLHRFLHQLIRDEDFKPGNEHSRLLRLPWRDVFTTNWDTLLERARSHVAERAYSVIRDMDEIPLANQPRIVKLHGSLPAQFPLIFTEEDYRTYPVKFAPFVNTVQQAMMETVFCLIGFSGSDPNFLHWSGWVRDNLGAAAPKIYLAGWFNLSPHRRRMLESRGVVPIDLAQHPKAHDWPEHLRHRYAAEWVLHTLERGRPYDVTAWPSPQRQPNPEIPEHLKPVTTVTSKQPREEKDVEPQIGPSDLREAVRRTLEIWKHNRSLYPGWLLFPSGEERENLSRRTGSWEGHILSSLPEFTPVERLNAVRELVWRHEILLEPISTELEAAVEEALKSIDCHSRRINEISEATADWVSVREAWRTAALTLLTPARFRFDRDLFDQRIETLKPFMNDDPDVAHRVLHEQCLWEIYSIDFEALERLLKGWAVKDCDPIWMIRKAALLTEVRHYEESASLIQSALTSLRSDLVAGKSIASASREGWALASTMTFNNRQEISREWAKLSSQHCDAGAELDLLRAVLRGSKERDDTPSFDLGTRQVTQRLFSNSGRAHRIAAYRAIRLPEVAGLPPVNNPSDDFVPVSMVSDTLRLAADELIAVEPELAIRLTLRICNYDKDKTLQRVLSRPLVATLSGDTVVTLAQICTGIIKYALPRLFAPGVPTGGIAWVERMRVALEVLSRLVLRLPPDMVNAALDIGMECYQADKVAQHPWLGPPVGNLLRRSLEALPKDARTSRALDLLVAPIVGLDGFAGDAERPDPGEFLRVEDLPAIRTSENDDRWREVVNYIARGLSHGGEARKRASLRILPLAFKGVLTETESLEIAQALWSDKHTPSNDLPSNTPLYDWTFLLLPEPNPGLAEQRFRLKWLSGNMDKFRESTQSRGNTISVPIGVKPVNSDKLEDVLWNVGAAVSGLREHGRSLQFTDAECKYVVDMVEHWVDTDITSHPLPFIHTEARQPTRWAIQGLVSILPEVTISKSAGERLYEKLRKLTDSGTPSFELVHGLVKTIPGHFDELVNWLRMGLVSDDNALAASAISGLRSWLEASVDAGASLRPPPDDMLREVGLMIASRRSVALPHALQLARWVFNGGTPSQREIISPLVLQGLSYLAEELKYDREHDQKGSIDVPLFRLLCAQIAQSMAQSGLSDEQAVELWIKIAREDPLPEVRHAVTPSDCV